MKIAMIGHKRIPSREGGVEVVVEELATRMAKQGNSVTCYNRRGKHVLDKKQKIKKISSYKGIRIKNVITLDFKGFAALSSSFFATLSVLFSNYDVVHYHAEGPCFWLWLFRIFSKKKVVVTIHGLDWQRSKWGGLATKIIKIGEKEAVKYADEIIVLSKNVKRYFKEVYDRDTNFIPNGVNEPEILKANLIKKKYNLRKDEYILYLGRIVPEKGIHYLISAYNNLETNKKLVIAGGSSDTDSYFKELQNMSNNKNIIFTGFVHGQMLQELYSNAYIYCLPSDVEGMPLSLLEAMSYGNCCITSDIEECKEVIKHNGITFKKSNESDLKEKIMHAIKNENMVKKIKEESRKYVLDNYNWDSITYETLKIYEKR